MGSATGERCAPGRAAFVLSLSGNGLALAAALVLVRRRGGVGAVLRVLRRGRAEPPAFARAEPGTTVFAGDSHVERAPLLEMLTDHRRCGAGGQTVEQVASWLPAVVGPEVGHLVLSAGSNDVLQGAAPATVLGRYARLLDRLPASVPVTVLGLPALAGHEGAAAAVDAGLRRLADSRGLQFLALTRTPGGDGIHLGHDDYLRLAPALRRLTAARGGRPGGGHGRGPAGLRR